MLNDQQIEKLISDLTLDEMIGQMLCYFYEPKKHDNMAEIAKRTRAGNFFIDGIDADGIKKATAILDGSKIPPMIAADIECGIGHVVPGETKFPDPMAWGACNDEKLIEFAHEENAKRSRLLGIHWTFSPIVDINKNHDNPVTNIRAISDEPERVARIGAAAVIGCQKNGYLAAGCKHFPGDGIDDRDQHLCTTVNSLSMDEWWDSFGYVYKKMFEADTASVMVGHISLPAYDEKLNEWVGYPPASLSYNLQTKLLKGELGFKGCIVSDALSMVGACACVDHDRLAIEFIKAGGDMLLFPLAEDFDRIKGAVESGEISIERIKDAVRRIIALKDKARLFEDQEKLLAEINVEENKKNLKNIAKEIAERSLSLVRNYAGALPLDIKPGSKILIITLMDGGKYGNVHFVDKLDTLENELKARGYEVVSYVNASRNDFKDDLPEAAAVLINCRISCRDYIGGTLRTGWDHIGAFWRGEILKHPKVIFTSFGDPYKLYDFPYLKTYVNAFSYRPDTQRAFVKALFGEIPFAGKSPVSLEGFFSAEN